MTPPDLRSVKSLLDGPSPAVLATHRKNGTMKLSPVWFRYEGAYFEIVIADDDVKLKHITPRPPRDSAHLRDDAALSRGTGLRRS
jgi:hypothetical protein